MQLPRLKEWRESRGLLQKELAAEAGLSEFTITRIEGGDSIRPNTARRVADALGVSVGDLMERPPVPLVEAPEAGRAVTPQLITLAGRLVEAGDAEGLTLLREDLEAVRVSLGVAHHDDPGSRALEREFARAVERAMYVGLRLAALREARTSGAEDLAAESSSPSYKTEDV